MFGWDFWIGVLCSTVACFVYKWISLMLLTDGVLKIDCSNPQKDVYRIVLSDLSRLSKKKRIVLKVDPRADLSQE